MIDATVIWDLEDDPGGNVQHLAEHGITVEEAEEVLRDPRSRTGRSRRTGRPQVFGALPFFGASIPGFVGLLTGRGPFSPALALIPGRSVFGSTSSGKFITVIWEEVLDDPRTIYPVTAYEVPPPQGRKR
ncbi:MAG: hypothetical protein WBX00_34485 [Isosphaeraceae bacterium]